MATKLLNLTELGLFSGLYESLWLNENSLYNECDAIKEELIEHKLIEEPFQVTFVISADQYLKEIGKLYCNWLETQSELTGSFTVDSVISPLYYNYTTDIIYIKWENPDLSEEEMNQQLRVYEDMDIEDLTELELNNIYDFMCGYEILDEIAKYQVINKYMETYTLAELKNQYLEAQLKQEGIVSMSETDE